MEVSDFKGGPDFQGWLDSIQKPQESLEVSEIPETSSNDLGETKTKTKTKKWFFKFNIWSVSSFNNWFSGYYGLPAPLKSIDLNAYGDKGQKASDQLLDRICDIGIVGKLISRINGLTKGSEKWDDIFDLIEDMTEGTFKEIREHKDKKK